MTPQEYQQQQNEKLLKSYGIDLEKSGEGSRGGKVIGHTKSGKPIYDTYQHKSHKGFTKEDHEDARNLHYNKAVSLSEGKEYKDYQGKNKKTVTQHHIQASNHNSHVEYLTNKEDHADKRPAPEDNKSKSKSSSFDKEVKEVMDASFNLSAEKHLQTAKTLRQQAKKLKSDLASGKYGQGATANSELRKLEHRAKIHEAVHKEKLSNR